MHLKENVVKIVRLAIAGLILFCPLLCQPSAASSGTGLATAEFLTIIPNPQSAAMGGGSLADSSNIPSSAINNPASLMGIIRPQLTFNSLFLQEDVNYNFGSFALPTAFGIIGGSFGYLSYGDIPGYTNSAEQISIPESHDMVAVMSYALPFKTTVPLVREHGAVGINLKFLQSKLSYYSVESIAVDVGAIYKIPWIDGLSIGAAYKNVGSGMKFAIDSNALPSSLDLGIGYKNPYLYNFATTLDFHRPDSGPSYFSAGVSISPVYSVNLRGGWVENPDSPFTGFRAGVGLVFGEYAVDYSFTPAKYFSPLHHIGVTIAVGDILKQETASDYYLEQHFHAACEYYYRKDYIEARQRFEEILSLYPNHHPSQKYLEKISVGIDKMEMKKNEDIRNFLAKADAAMTKQDYLTAQSCYNRVLAIEPDQNDANVGLELMGKKVAEVKQEKERQKNRHYIQKLWNDGLALFQKGDFVKSKSQFKAILDIDPENEEAKKLVVEVDNQLTKIAASQIESLYSHACEFYKKGQYDRALPYFEAVAIAAPYRMDAQDFVVQCHAKLKEQKDKERAETLAQRQGEMKDEMSAVFNNGLKAYEKGNYEEALKFFTKSQELATKYEFTEYLNNTNNYLSMINIALAEKHYKIGFEHFRKNRVEAAAREYRKALEYSPDHTSAKVELERISKDIAQQYYERGMAAFGQGNNDKAREYFQESLTYQGDKAESLRALERLK